MTGTGQRRSGAGSGAAASIPSGRDVRQLRLAMATVSAVAKPVHAA